MERIRQVRDSIRHWLKVSWILTLFFFATVALMLSERGVPAYGGEEGDSD